MTTNKDLSLYFHIPFCVKKCEYCAFYSLPRAGEEIKALYFDAIKKQISFLPRERRIISVYFGGGTPPVLGVNRLCKLVESVVSGFRLSDNCEITVEINPGTAGAEELKSLRAAGFNRISLGIQSADDAVLTRLGRIHDYAAAEKCVAYARAAGFDNLSADVMFALPGQTAEGFLISLEKIVSLGPDHISAYSLQLEEETPFYSKRDLLDFPEEDVEEAQYGSLCGYLKSKGYEHYEVSSFAKPGFKARHNSVYWDMGEYFGLGAAAHSFFNGKRFYSPPDVNAYIKKAQEGLFAPTNYEEALVAGEDDMAEERLMLGLRTSAGATVPTLKKDAAERIARLGYGTFDGERLILNDKGFRVSNAIIAKLI